MKNYAIIVAGGAGKRIGGKIAKQFLLIDGLPILMHTINAFASSNFNPSVFVVLSEKAVDFWQAQCATYSFNTPHKIILGGDERFHSVKNALEEIDGEGLVAVHDGVRPLISKKLIDNCYLHASKLGNAIPAVAINESIRQKKHTDKSKILKRDEIFLVQTPQTFRIELLKDAYKQKFSHAFTDDASVVEKKGQEIFLIEGDRTNIKITYQSDLDFAEWWIKKNPPIF